MSLIKITASLALLICFSLALPARAQTEKRKNTYYLTDSPVGFNSLISKFKGKIIYVDIWATWCPPCRDELRHKHDIKAFSDFASNNNIVILYVCCDMDNKEWKQFISQNKLNGYHVLINDALNNDLHARFSYAQTGKINLKMGFYIPRHMIIDKTGAIIDSMADRQGSASVYARLDKIIK